MAVASGGAALEAHGVELGDRYVVSAWDAAVMAALACSAALHIVGSLRLARHGGRQRTSERAAFWAGWACLVAAVAPPLDRAAAGTFSMHMVQHELLMLIGAPLVVLGRPIVPWLWALGARLRPAAASALGPRAGGAVWRALTQPLVAWVAYAAAIWVWHVPAFYEAALEHEALHALQHAVFVGAAVVFWWGIVRGRYGRAGYGAAALYVFTTMVHTGVLGAMFALSTAPVVPHYEGAVAGVDPLADQQLAGFLMWIPSGLVLTACGIALLLAWIAESDRRASARRLLGLVLAVGAASASIVACNAIPDASAAAARTGGDPARGRDRIRQYGCDSCHTIPGISTADATVGPPLTQVARRMFLAGRLPNTPENMARWIAHPQQVEPGTAMPEMGVTPADSRDIVAYLYTLR